LKLTSVARASLEELRLDYEDFLRQRGLNQWAREDPLRKELVARRFKTADEIARWVKEIGDRKSGLTGRSGPGRQNINSGQSTVSTKSTYSEIAANAALTLIAIACSLLDRQIAAQSKTFEQEGGFTEKMYRKRQQARKSR